MQVFTECQFCVSKQLPVNLNIQAFISITDIHWFAYVAQMSLYKQTLCIYTSLTYFMLLLACYHAHCV